MVHNKGERMEGSIRVVMCSFQRIGRRLIRFAVNSIRRSCNLSARSMSMIGAPDRLVVRK